MVSSIFDYIENGVMNRIAKYSVNPLRTAVVFFIMFCAVNLTAQDFEASKNISDSKIYLEWKMPVPNTIPGNPEVYIQVRERATGKEVFSEILDSINNYDTLFGVTHVYTKPSSSREYEMRILEYGPGTILLANVFTTGTTTAFVPPSFAGSLINPWSIDLTFNSNSDYDSKMYLFRNDSLIKILDTSSHMFSDVCNPSDPNSIINGQSYRYKLLSVNDATGDTVASSTLINRNTFGLNFSASRNALKDTVSMVWNNVSGFVSKLIISRDGTPIAELNGKDNYYHDLSPIPGKNHLYSITLYDSKDEAKLTLSNIGSIEAIGLLHGWVMNDSDTGDFTIPNVKILAEASVEGENIKMETVTDANGYYEFGEVPFSTKSTFTLTASGKSMVFNNNDQEIALDLNSPKVRIDFKANAPSNELQSPGFSLNSFTAASSDSFGWVKLLWNTTGADTIHYYIYRANKLIKIGHQVGLSSNEYLDLEGTPGASYTYSIRTYSRNYNSQTNAYDYAFTNEVSTKATFPQPFAIPLTQFNVTALSSSATTKLSWWHTQGNIDGFNVFRDDELIATLPKVSKEFIDLTGANDTGYEYAVNAFKTLGSKQYNSSKAIQGPVLYPTLQKPNISSHSFTPEGFVKIKWNYPVANNYNYDGFHIIRAFNGKSTTIATIRKNLPFEYIDFKGVPGRTYSYYLLAYKENLKSISAISNAHNVTYPELPKIEYVVANGYKEGLITIQTETKKEHSYLEIAVRNIDENVTYSTFKGFEFNEANIPWNDYSSFYANLSVTYVKTVDGVKYYGSDTTRRRVLLTEPINPDLDSVTNLTASANYSSHVKLCWDYPDYLIPEFEIFRDGFSIGKVEGVHKSFYDHNVDDNYPHVYQVQVFLDGKTSHKNGVIGKKVGKTRVMGSAYTLHRKKGIPNSLVSLYIPEPQDYEMQLYAQTTTDEFGYYEFLNVPTFGIPSGSFELMVKVEHPNARFAKNTISQTYLDNKSVYIADFVDTLPNSFIKTDTIATVSDIMAISNVQSNSVDIRWQASNANYTSFEVYRGLVLIATIPGSQSKFVRDDEGLPGYEYSYRIKPIWQKDRLTVEEGKFFSVQQYFPPILSVENLNHSILHDAVRVKCSHATDINLDYIVMRNDDVFKIVRSGEKLEVVDNVGAIGSVYKYTIIPVLSSNHDIVGPSLSTIAIFPRVAQVKSVTATNVTFGLLLRWSKPSERTTHYKIYCNGKLVDTLESNSNSLSYVSYHGIPKVGVNNAYSVSPGYQLNGEFFFGKKATVSARHNPLPRPSIITVSPIQNEDKVVLKSPANYDRRSGVGIEYFRNGDLLGRIEADNFQFEGVVPFYIIEDKGGLPGVNANYFGRYYSIRDGITYYSSGFYVSPTTFPKLSKPYNAVVNGNKGMYRTVQWKHNREDVTFEIKRYTNFKIRTFPEIDGNLNSFKDVEKVGAQEILYSIRAVFRNSGTPYYSDYEITLPALGQGKNVLASGYNGNGALGNGNTNNLTSFTYVNSEEEWVSIAAGADWGLGIKTDGTLWGWGSNQFGKNGTGATRSTPAQIGTDDKWVKVAVGWASSFGLKSDGSIWSWGNNGRGNLGNGSYSGSSTPSQIGTSYKWKNIEAALSTTFFIREDGTLWGCGDNLRNQLGITSARYNPSLRQIGADKDWRTVSSGVNSILGIKTNGTLWAWGDNSGGQLGLGTSIQSYSSPRRVGSATNWVQVRSGLNHSVAGNTFGNIQMTGNNTFGQIGSGAGSTTFAHKSGPSDVISAGIYNTLFKRWNSRLYYTGVNNYGQLGTGNTLNVFSNSAFRDIGGGIITGISAGERQTFLFMMTNANSSFTATDGTLGSKVLLEWNDLSGATGAKSIEIYRDGQLISIEKMTVTTYTDLDAVPGKKHAYSLRILKSNGKRIPGRSDIGWRTPNGVVKGSVISLVGNQPVPDVNIHVKVSTDEGNFYYSGISDSKGNFRIEDVYYNDFADVTVSASYLNHEFVEDTLFGEMDETINTLTIGVFVDKTANLIAGTLTRNGSECPLDSVQVKLVKHYTSKADIEETTTTEMDGTYAFSVNPHENDLSSFELVLADKRISGADTIFYDWNRNNVIVDKSIVGTNTPRQDFVDLLSVLHQFSVRNTCENYSNVRFFADIISTDGCYEKSIVSNDNGVFPFQDLPPLNYIVSITSASPLNSDIAPILDYLAVRPIKLDLSRHAINRKGDSSFNKKYLEKLDFIFHSTPQISFTKNSGIENIPCNPDMLLVTGAPNAVNVNVTFNVLETHGATTCAVDEGFLVIKNEAATKNITRIFYNDTLGGFPDYEFTPGLPSTISPYYKTMVVEYHTSQGFVSQNAYGFIVTGKSPQPGSDVIIDKEDGKNFQIPLAVLRDPPGDNSYSYLSKDVESTKTFSVDREFGGSITLSGSTGLGIFGIGIEVEASATTGGSDGNENSLSISHSTSQQFATSASSDIQNSSGSEYMVGDNADVIIGTGMALKYGIIESITYDPTTCQVSKSSEIGISPDKLTTTWVYNVAHIENIINEYENLLKLVKEGRVTISDQSGSSDTKDSNFYRTLIDNWKGVLEYHRKNTLPHYNLCDRRVLNRDFDVRKVGIFETQKALEIKETAKTFVEDCFCSEVGTYDDNDKFTLNSGFKWTDNLLLKYQIAKMRRDELLAYHKMLEEGLVIGAGYTPPSLEKYADNDEEWEKKLSSENKAVAENITFSGNSSVEKSFTKSASTSHSYTQNIYGDASVYAGILIVSELDVSTWAGIGGGVAIKSNAAVDLETRAGLEASFDFNISNQASTSQTTTTTSGYVLADDDAGDQFSVTTIKGIEDMHTPYFELFAGRSSCPYEPGTIARDRPILTLEYPDGSVFPNNVLRDLKPADGGYFSLKLGNQAPEIFDEYRYYNIVQAPNSNQNGAFLRALGSGTSYPVTYKVKSGGSTYAGLIVNKTGNFYDYPDINLQAIPTCLDAKSDIVDGFNGADLALEAYFRRPCSGISILDPGDNWRIINGVNQLGQKDQKLSIKVGDFDPYNIFLEEISFEYRRIGTSAWNTIQNSKISKDSLQRYYQKFKSVYRDPVYTFIWDIEFDDEVIDGEYEIRGVVHCGIEGEIFSNIITGKVDRTAIALLGIPKPTDGVLNIGENVEVVFNESIECGYETKAREHYAFYKKSDNAKLSFTPNCRGNSIIYTYDGDLDQLDGEVIRMFVFGVQDLNGNVLRDTIKYEFLVNRSPVSWQPYTFSVDVYKGESKLVNLQLVNTGGAKANVRLSKTGTPGNILEILNPIDSLFQNTSKAVSLRINGQNQNIGSYDYVLSAEVETFAKNYGLQNIPIQVNVLPVPPDWRAPLGKPLSSVVICNFELDGLRSIDTMDRIAITIDKEVRGFGNVYKSRAGSNIYYAIVNVQGDNSDLNKELGYRIWDASQGAEYDGAMTGNTITFSQGIFGTALSPRIIAASTAWDSVRYIPLIKGWNWLAFNYKKKDLSVDNMLSGLNLSGGEIIKTLSKQSIYNDSTNSWFSTNLPTISTTSGYHLFLNRDDVLRISGNKADFKPMAVQAGWTLLGNPYQQNQDINQVFVSNPNVENGAILKTGGKTSKAAVLEGGAWTGSITEYETNQAYMLYNAKDATLQLNRRSSDCDNIKSEQFQYNMTIFGSVLFDWSELQVEGDYVIAVIDGVCRGKGVIEEVSTPTRRFMLNMFIYGDSADLGKEVSFRIYRQNKNTFYDAFVQGGTLKFTPDLHRGLPNNPYWFSNDIEFLGTDKVPGQSPGQLELKLFPNPFKDGYSIKLKADKAGEARVEMFDMMGRSVHFSTQKCKIGLNEFSVNPEGLLPGVFTVRIRLNGRLSMSKLMKED